MDEHILESVQSATYLGVTLSADLKWNNHIQQMTSKANKSLSFIRRNLQINSKSVKDRAYQSLVRPKLIPSQSRTRSTHSNTVQQRLIQILILLQNYQRLE